MKIVQAMCFHQKICPLDGMAAFPYTRMSLYIDSLVSIENFEKFLVKTPATGFLNKFARIFLG